jgi:2-polyprenyl-3-methyl-5-hydroxy-6-metoxy-1,4-benzoquinol methylase
MGQDSFDSGNHSVTTWNVQTDASEEEIKAFLKEYSPWRALVTFNNRISSDAYETYQPFNRTPLNKIAAVEPHVPKSVLGGNILDIGFNCGYNSIYLASTYGARPVGIENNPRHQKVATHLASLSRVKAEFLIGDAENFLRKNAFDLIVHFGTLYHLPNPMLALATCAENLRANRWLALETTAYIAGSDPKENLWVYGFNGDTSNFWAISKTTLEEMLTATGFADVKLITESFPPIYKGKMSRVIYVARKAS